MICILSLIYRRKKESNQQSDTHIILLSGTADWSCCLMESPPQLSYIYRFIKKCLNFCLDNWTTILACGTIDLRKGINGLATIISDKYGQNLFEKRTLYLFCRKRSDRCKGLLWMGTGFLLLYKRFEAGRLSRPRNTQEAADLTKEQYKYLMMGLNPLDPKIKDVNPKNIYWIVCTKQRKYIFCFAAEKNCYRLQWMTDSEQFVSLLSSKRRYNVKTNRRN